MVNIVLMAGSGKRFSDAGYMISKPLLPVENEPMIIQATKSMPKSDRWIFVIRKEHLEEKEVVNALKSISKNVTLVVDPNPIGQLNSCLVAKDYFPKNESMFVGACDFGMIFDKKRYNSLSKNFPDVVSFSFTKQQNLSRNPNAWGWLRIDKNHNINSVSVKIPISSNPINDFAITGSFAFKNGTVFMELAEELMRRGVTVNGEYYIDSMLSIACEKNMKVISFPVEKYVGWGTPADYEEYMYWENIFLNNKKDEEAKNKPEYKFWKEYFESRNDT